MEKDDDYSMLEVRSSCRGGGKRLKIAPNPKISTRKTSIVVAIYVPICSQKKQFIDIRIYSTSSTYQKRKAGIRHEISM
eukprot:scaffold6418_cov120-Skeletonema_menzelii.AAC.3